MSRTSRRAGLGGAVAALAVLGLAVPAWAWFSVPSTAATAAARAATLGTPSVATSGVSASSVTFTVSATASETLGEQAPMAGQLLEGWDADVITVDCDPVVDIGALADPDRITGVWRRGVPAKLPTVVS